MKWNIIRAWRERRDRKRKLRDTLHTLQTWRWLEQAFEAGLLLFDAKQHRLFIMQPMAKALMANGADGWVNSIHAIFEYTYFRLCQQEWEGYMQSEELAAVRNAMATAEPTPAENPSALSHQSSALSREDIERIKRARRAEIALSDMEPPKVEPFEFFIIPDSKEAKVEPVAIGFYDPETGRMEVNLVHSS